MLSEVFDGLDAPHSSLTSIIVSCYCCCNLFTKNWCDLACENEIAPFVCYFEYDCIIRCIIRPYPYGIVVVQYCSTSSRKMKVTK